MPDGAQREILRTRGQDSPIYMVNLVKFKDKAIYEDQRITNLTGREAFHLYEQEVNEMLQKHNAKLIFVSTMTELIIGEVEELWDEVAIVKYASRKDLIDLATSPEWEEISIHRSAGIEGQLLIESIQPFIG